MRRTLRTPSVLLGLFLLYSNLGLTNSKLDAASSAVVFLRSDPAANTSLYATGFLVADEHNMLLVTARHVALHLGRRAAVICRGRGNTPITFAITDLAGPSKRLDWRMSPDSDVAALRLNPSEEVLNTHLQGRFLPKSMISQDTQAPSRDLLITVLGFPLALGATGHFSPISRETKAASGLLTIDFPPPLNLKNVTVFITQDPSIGGFSGAPVFDTGLPASSAHAGLVIRRPGIVIVGLASATLPDDTGGKLGVVMPAYKIMQLIDSIEPGTP